MIKRFIWVFSPRSTTLHMAVSKSEGLTHCGRAVTRSWKWVTPAPRGRRRCKQCQQASI